MAARLLVDPGAGAARRGRASGSDLRPDLCPDGASDADANTDADADADSSGDIDPQRSDADVLHLPLLSVAPAHSGDAQVPPQRTAAAAANPRRRRYQVLLALAVVLLLVWLVTTQLRAGGNVLPPPSLEPWPGAGAGTDVPGSMARRMEVERDALHVHAIGDNAVAAADGSRECLQRLNPLLTADEWAEIERARTHPQRLNPFDGDAYRGTQFPSAAVMECCDAPLVPPHSRANDVFANTVSVHVRSAKPPPSGSVGAAGRGSGGSAPPSGGAGYRQRTLFERTLLIVNYNEAPWIATNGDWLRWYYAQAFDHIVFTVPCNALPVPRNASRPATGTGSDGGGDGVQCPWVQPERTDYAHLDEAFAFDLLYDTPEARARTRDAVRHLRATGSDVICCPAGPNGFHNHHCLRAVMQRYYHAVVPDEDRPGHTRPAFDAFLQVADDAILNFWSFRGFNPRKIWLLPVAATDMSVYTPGDWFHFNAWWGVPRLAPLYDRWWPARHRDELTRHLPPPAVRGHVVPPRVHLLNDTLPPLPPFVPRSYMRDERRAARALRPVNPRYYRHAVGHAIDVVHIPRHVAPCAVKFMALQTDVFTEVAAPMALFSCTRNGAADVELLRPDDLLWEGRRAEWPAVYSPRSHFLHPVKGVAKHAVRWMRASRSARLRIDAQRQWERQLIDRAATISPNSGSADPPFCPVPLPRVFRRHWDDTALAAAANAASPNGLTAQEHAAAALDAADVFTTPLPSDDRALQPQSESMRAGMFPAPLISAAPDDAEGSGDTESAADQLRDTRNAFGATGAAGESDEPYALCALLL